MIHRTQMEPELKSSKRISKKALKTLPRAVQWTLEDSRRTGERGEVELGGKREVLITIVMMPLLFLKLLLSTSAMLNTFTRTISFNVKYVNFSLGFVGHDCPIFSFPFF